MVSSSASDTTSRRGVALLPWGNIIEDFLDRIGISLEDYCERMTGGWCFGYVEALHSAGWRPVIFLVSRCVAATKRFRHEPTGALICVLPAWSAYRSVTRYITNPYGGSVEGVFGRVSRLRWPSCFAYKEIAPYLATPLGALARQLRRERCAAILTQEYEYARFDMCVSLGKLLGLPVYATFQGGDRQVGWLARLVRPAALRAARGVVIGAGGEARRVREQYGIDEGKIWRIPNPIDLELWRPIDRVETRQTLGVPLGSRIVVYHGRIEMHRKGLDVLLDAWERIRAGRPGQDERLLLIGSGHDDAWLRERLGRPELSGVHWVDRYELDRRRCGAISPLPIFTCCRRGSRVFRWRRWRRWLAVYRSWAATFRRCGISSLAYAMVAVSSCRGAIPWPSPMQSPDCSTDLDYAAHSGVVPAATSNSVFRSRVSADSSMRC